MKTKGFICNCPNCGAVCFIEDATIHFGLEPGCRQEICESCSTEFMVLFSDKVCTGLCTHISFKSQYCGKIRKSRARDCYPEWCESCTVRLDCLADPKY